MILTDQELLKQATIRIKQLQAKLQERTQPIAIVGLACRFPGARDKDAYWRLLKDGVDAITEVPRERWDVDAYYDPDPEVPGKMSTRYGGFIDGIDWFDPAFFSITPREATDLDPQQRLLLEIGWHALEDAGMNPQRLVGSRTGVYIGLSTSDYTQLIARGGMEAVGPYVGTGVSHSVAVGRVSFALGLQGPSIAVDTACSSSLVAIHLACRGLLSGDCDVALAGGVNAILTPEPMIYFSKGRFMAPDGRCKAFDAAADGYVRGEGCGIVVLKRLADARREGDRVYAVVLGSAVNQDGRSSGLTVPNGPAQEQVIADALARAQVPAQAVSYVEAHGTGTALGDPIEIHSLHSALGRSRPKGQPLLVGSVKTNIGHLEAAAGVAGVVKLALALERGIIPGQLHFANPSPRIAWDSLNVRVATSPSAWPDARPVAGVSSFAFQGTNSHVILAAPEPIPTPERPSERDRSGHVLPLSGRTDQALRDLASQYVTWLDEHPEADLADICYTAGVGRSHFPHRAALVVDSRERLRAMLANVADGQESPSCFTGNHRSRPKVALLFTGQASQYPGMARGLYDTQPVFRETIDRCAVHLEGELEHSLLDLLFTRELSAHKNGTAANGRGGEDAHSPLLEHTRYAQPAIFAVEAALYDLYKSLGVEPAAVLGHSLGEYAAAYAAGVFGLEDGLRLVARRGRYFGALPAVGAMVAIMADGQAVTAALEGTGLSLAADNGDHAVVSGPRDHVESLAQRFESRGIRCVRLKTRHAFHSPMLEPALVAFARDVADIDYRAPDVPMVSGLSGRVLEAGRAPDGPYWLRQAREPVQFARGIASIEELGCTLLLELGPDLVLGRMAAACWQTDDLPATLVALKQGVPDHQQLCATLAELYARGVPVNFAAWDRPWPRRKLALPGYPFQRQRYWVETPARSALPFQSCHPLLGVEHSSALGQRTWDATLRLSEQMWLKDHRVFGAIVAPGALFACMALAAGGKRAVRLIDGQFTQGLVLRDEDEVQLQLVVCPPVEGVDATHFKLFSRARARAEWRQHAVGRIEPGSANASATVEPLANLRARMHGEDVDRFYARCAEMGVVYGPHFRAIVELWSGDGQAMAVIEREEGLKSHGVALHPTVLDACWQVTAAAFEEAAGGDPYVPWAWERIELHREAPARLICHARRRDAGEGTIVADLLLFDEREEVVGEIIGLTCRRATRQTLVGHRAWIDDLLYEMQWPEAHVPGRIVPAHFFPHPLELAAEVRPEADSILAEAGLEARAQRDIAEGLERLSRAYVTRALTELGWEPEPGKWVDVPGLLSRGIAANHRKLLGRLLELLGASGMLQRTGDRWQVVRSADTDDPEALHQGLLECHPTAEIELELLSRCGGCLAEILKGKINPLELLFPGAGSGAEQLYHDAPGAKVFNRILQSVVSQAVRRLPPERKLRVLEVGAGTGGTTRFVLEVLPRDRAHYVYTDVSAGFLHAAERRFGADDSRLEFRTLDIERDPIAQGFPRHGYDLIIASNVLHATRNLEETLEHCGRILAPSGLIVLLEGLRPQGWLDLTFGLLGGWWRFDDPVRHDYPLLDAAGWSKALVHQGFSAAEAIHPNGVNHQAVLVARGPDSARVSESEGLWVLVADRRGVARALAGRLSETGQKCLVVEPGARFETIDDRSCQLKLEDAEDWRQLFARMPNRLTLRGVVQLAALDKSGGRTMTSEILKAEIRHAGASTLALAQGLLRAEARPTAGLWLITEGAQSTDGEPCASLAGSALWGMARGIAVEHPELHCRCVDADDAMRQLEALTNELLAPDQEDQIAWRGSRRLSARLVRSSAVAERIDLPSQGTFRLAKGRDRTLDGLHAEALNLPAPGPKEVQVAVRAAGLNFRDVLDSLGFRPGDAGPLGGELAGRVIAVGDGVREFAIGDEVVGIAAGCFANRVNTAASLLARKPRRLRAAEAATLPVVFTTAQLAYDLAQLQPGEKVLIHAGAGGVGLAAIQLAQSLGAKVYATASAGKREVLRELGVQHVYDSRSTEFAERILSDTDGAGVDVVLNSLTSEGFIAASLRCLAPRGRFVEIAKQGIWTAEQMREARPDLDYYVLALDRETVERPAYVGEIFKRIMERVEAGVLEPLRHRTFPLSAATLAMRFMQQARHVGKLVLTVPHLAGESLPADRTYLITGGLGGLGLELARWLVGRGARHIVLNGRRAPGEPAQSVLRELRGQGVEARVLLADVSVAEDVERLLREIDAEMPPLAGIVHAAGLLRDGALLNQTWERFEEVLAPKAVGGWLLHQATASRDLELFVLFGSTVGLLGNYGQANHAAANALLDQLARHRRADGSSANAVDWGAWAVIGEAAERAKQIRTHLAAAGVGWIDPSDGFAALERILTNDWEQVGVSPIDWPKFVARLDRSAPLLESLLAPPSLENDRPSSPALLGQLEQANSAQRHLLLAAYVAEQIRRVLRLDDVPENDATFFDLGMDSLMAVELRNRLNADLRIQPPLPTNALFEHSTTHALTALIANRVPSTPAGESEQSPLVLCTQISPTPQDRHAPFPLREIQEAYLVGREAGLEGGGVSCHYYLEEDGVGTNVERLNAAWNRLVAHHDMLRAVILPDGRQRVLEEVPTYTFGVADLSDDGAADQEAALEAIRQTMSHRVADPESWPLFEIRVTRLGAGRVRLHISFDLLIADAASLLLLFREWGLLYENPDAALPPLELTFRDCVLAESALVDSAVSARARSYWWDRLATLPPAPELPILDEPAGSPAQRFVRRTGDLSAERWARLKARASREQVTSSALLCAAYADALADWSKHARFTLVVTLFNRPFSHPQLNQVVGDFTSTILLEVDGGAGTFADRAQRLQFQLASDLDHAALSGVRVLREINRLNPSERRIMPVVFTSLLGHQPAGEEHTGLTVLSNPVYGVSQTPQVWLDLQIREERGALCFNLDALEARFPTSFLDDLFGAYCRLLELLADDEPSWTQRLVLVPPAQLELRALMNSTSVAVPDLLLQELVSAQAAERPEQPAVRSPRRCLSYRELEQFARQVGTALRRLGARPNQLVAVVLEKGWEQVVTVLGVLHSSAAYLPLDPDLPGERLRSLLELSQVELIVTTRTLSNQLAWPEGPRRFCIDELASLALVDEGLEPLQDSSDLAYVIFTSGSTGVPKGVMIDHRGAVNTILDINRRFGIGAGDSVLALSSLTFDLSVYDIFGILAAGGTIVFPDASRLRDPGHWIDLVGRERVTVWNSVPALMRMVTEYLAGRDRDALASLRVVMLSGDWIPVSLPDQIRAAAGQARVISLGGATEASIWSIFYPIDRIDPGWKSIPYGRPLANQTFHVLNADFQPCPVWVTGELYIGGIGLALGYWRDEEKTHARFVVNPHTGERLYRTGDWGRYLPDGHIEFLGRDDLQVKVQGYRIELAEVEAALLAHAGVSAAVAVAVGERRGDKRLIAYLEPREPLSRTNGLAEPIHARGDDAPVTLIEDPLRRLQFRLQEPALLPLDNGRDVVALPSLNDEEAQKPALLRRRSARRFGADRLPLESLGEWLANLAQTRLPGETFAKYRYPSAGGLYPVQVYLYVRPGCVAGLDGGAYYHHPKSHRLLRLSSDARLDSRIHAPVNRALFDGSAFSVFLIGELSAIAPLYGTLSRDLCLLEAGYMGQLLVTAAAPLGIGLCPIGGCQEPAVRKAFGLEESQIILHSFVGGALHVEISPVSELAEQTPPMVEFQTTEPPKQHVPLSSMGHGIFVEDVRSFVRTKLPPYMVPSEFIVLDTLPLTTNGKVDRGALAQLPHTSRAPEPGPTRRNGFARGKPGSPHSLTHFERALIPIVQELAGQTSVGIDDNFFDLGITSLGMVRLQRLLREATGREVEIADLFDNPSIRFLADRMRRHEPESTTATAIKPPRDDVPSLFFWRDPPRSCLAELRRGGSQRPGGLFFLPDFTGNLSALNPLMAALGPDFTCCGLQSFLTEEPDSSWWSQQWLDHYAAAVRSRQRNGPYVFVGHSMGGVLALELAHAFHLAGEARVGVVLLDSRPHGSLSESAAVQELSLLDVFKGMRAQPVFNLDLMLHLLLRLEHAARSGKIPAGLSLIPMLQQLAALGQVPVREYAFPVLLLRAETALPSDGPDDDETFGWRGLCRGAFDVRLVPGDHFSMVRDPHARVVADRLQDWLDAVLSGWDNRESCLLENMSEILIQSARD